MHPAGLACAQTCHHHTVLPPWSLPSPCPPGPHTSPRCRPGSGHAGGGSRRARSPGRWPGSRSGGRSGRSSGPAHGAGSGTAHCAARTGRHLATGTHCAACPGRGRSSLWPADTVSAPLGPGHAQEGSPLPCPRPILTPAGALGSIAEVARLAVLAVCPLGVVQAALAVPSAWVTGAWVRCVDVAAALAGPAVPTRLLGSPKVPGRALLAAGPCGGQRGLRGGWTPAPLREEGARRPCSWPTPRRGTHRRGPPGSGRPPAPSGRPGGRSWRSSGCCRGPQGRGRAGTAHPSPAPGSQSNPPHTCGAGRAWGQGTSPALRGHPCPCTA